MSKGDSQVARAMAGSDKPADITEEKPLDVDTPPDRTRQFTHTSFSRIRTSWLGPDGITLARIRAQADTEMRYRFPVAFALMDEVWKSVRTPQCDEDTGEVLTNLDGSIKWAETAPGVPEERWDLLGHAQKERLYWAIGSHLFGWEQFAADLHAEAMYSKVEWEERFAISFFSVPSNQISGRPTVDDKTQYGHRSSVQERYFAVYCAELSRKADALVRSMTRIHRMLENTIIR